jgi:hypothetical protein
MLLGLASAEGFTRNDLNYAAGCSNRSANEATRRENPEEVHTKLRLNRSLRSNASG